MDMGVLGTRLRHGQKLTAWAEGGFAKKVSQNLRIQKKASSCKKKKKKRSLLPSPCLYSSSPSSLYPLNPCHSLRSLSMAETLPLEIWQRHIGPRLDLHSLAHLAACSRYLRDAAHGTDKRASAEQPLSVHPPQSIAPRLKLQPTVPGREAQPQPAEPQSAQEPGAEVQEPEVEESGEPEQQPPPGRGRPLNANINVHVNVNVNGVSVEDMALRAALGQLVAPVAQAAHAVFAAPNINPAEAAMAAHRALHAQALQAAGHAHAAALHMQLNLGGAGAPQAEQQQGVQDHEGGGDGAQGAARTRCAASQVS